MRWCSAWWGGGASAQAKSTSQDHLKNGTMSDVRHHTHGTDEIQQLASTLIERDEITTGSKGYTRLCAQQNKMMMNKRSNRHTSHAILCRLDSEEIWRCRRGLNCSVGAKVNCSSARSKGSEGNLKQTDCSHQSSFRLKLVIQIEQTRITILFAQLLLIYRYTTPDNTYINLYIYIYIYTYIHTYIHTYIRGQNTTNASTSV